MHRLQCLRCLLLDSRMGDLVVNRMDGAPRVHYYYTQLSSHHLPQQLPRAYQNNIVRVEKRSVIKTVNSSTYCYSPGRDECTYGLDRSFPQRIQAISNHHKYNSLWGDKFRWPLISKAQSVVSELGDCCNPIAHQNGPETI